VKVSQRTRRGDERVPLQLWLACLLLCATGKIVAKSKQWFAANPEDKQGCNKGESEHISNRSLADLNDFIHEYEILSVFHG
jgi:hypothetical protein